MSILKPIPADQVFRTHTHRGWLGLCPVWTNSHTGEVVERNGIPALWMLLNIRLIELVDVVRVAFGGESWPGWPIYLTGRIGPGVTR